LRKSLVIVLSLLLLAMLAVPATAAPAPVFSLNVNGAPYDGEFFVTDGTTMIPLDFVSSIIDARATVENEQIKIVKDNSVLLLKLNSKEADFNQNREVMLQAPVMNNEIYMVPLRYVLESFGNQVGWDAATYEITVNTAAQSAADQIFTRISEAMVKSNSYKMTAETTMQMDMSADGQNQQMTMSGTVNASVQQEPVLIVMETVINVDELSGTDEEIPADLLKTQMVFNEDGYFMTMPGQEGWVKLDTEGIDFNKIMEQYGSQDPVKSIMQMKEYGAVITLEDDQVIDGKTYGVIHIVMGQEAIKNLLNDILGQTGILGLGTGTEESAEVGAMMQELFSSIKADMDYDIVYDKDTLLPSAMSLDSVISMNMTIPADEANGTPASEMQMKVNQKADYQMYDYGIAFPVPVIDDYKTMDEMMAELQAVPVPAEES